MCLSSALAIKNIILRNPRWWMAYGETHSVSSWEIFCDFKRNRTADPISLTRFSVISGSRLTVRSKIHWWSSRSMRYRLSNDRRIVHSRRGAMLETTISSYHGPSSSSSSELLLSISITYCQMKKCQNTKSATDTFHGSKSGNSRPSNPHDPSLLRLRSGFCRPLYTFINYIYLLLATNYQN